MPSQTPTQTTTTNDTSSSVGTTASQNTSGANQFLAALLSGQERLEDQASVYFAHGIKFQKGMKGELVKRIQEAVGSGQDGTFGPNPETLLRKWQLKDGLPETGVVDESTWAGISSATANLKNLSGEEDFQKMWDAHPHNDQKDATLNTESGALLEQLGLASDTYENTCAIRMSTMMNRMGGNMALDTKKGKQARLDKMRSGGMYMPKVSDEKTEEENDRLIVSTREMWTYIEKHRGKPDLEFPPRGRYKTEEEVEEGALQAEQADSSRKGMVAFDKILTYGGSGHIDLFNGSQLLDGMWYPSERIKLWFIA